MEDIYLHVITAVNDNVPMPFGFAADRNVSQIGAHARSLPPFIIAIQAVDVPFQERKIRIRVPRTIAFGIPLLNVVELSDYRGRNDNSHWELF